MHEAGAGSSARTELVAPRYEADFRKALASGKRGLSVEQKSGWGPSLGRRNSLPVKAQKKVDIEFKKNRVGQTALRTRYQVVFAVDNERQGPVIDATAQST
jgi:hypothetical protein